MLRLWRSRPGRARRIKDAELAVRSSSHQADQAAEERKRAEAQEQAERRFLRPRLAAVGDDADQIAEAIARELRRRG